VIKEQDLHSFELKIGDIARTFWLPKTENQIAIANGIFSGNTFPDAPIDNAAVDCVFDVGANIGAATVFFRVTFPNAEVHAFEPNSVSFPLLQKNVAGMKGVKTHRFGLSDVDRQLKMSIGGGGGEFSSIKNGLFPYDHEMIEIKNAGTVLGELAETKQSIVLKIDTEGCEGEILESLSDIYQRIPVIYLEYHSENQRRRVDRVLTDNGMMMFAADSSGPHRGELTYIREEIIAAIPDLDAYRTD